MITGLISFKAHESKTKPRQDKANPKSRLLRLTSFPDSFHFLLMHMGQNTFPNSGVRTESTYQAKMCMNQKKKKKK